MDFERHPRSHEHLRILGNSRDSVCGKIFELLLKFRGFFTDKSLNLDSVLKKNLPSIPTTIDEEIKMNIFFRFDNASIKEGLNLKDSTDQEIFSKLRDLKDTF